MERLIRHRRQLLVAGMILLGLGYAGLWLGTRLVRPEGISFGVPIAPAHALHLNLWKPEADNTSFVFNGALAHEIARPLTIMVWHQHYTTTTMTRLVFVRLPAWPLLLIAGSMTFAAVRLWRRRET